jgi:hypothetical protein
MYADLPRCEWQTMTREMPHIDKRKNEVYAEDELLRILAPQLESVFTCALCAPPGGIADEVSAFPDRVF